MRVFSVEMLVKEEGAAVVEAALKRLKGEANAVAAEMKVTSSAVKKAGDELKGHAAVVAGYAKTASPIIDVNAKIAASIAATKDAAQKAADQMTTASARTGRGLQDLGAKSDVSASRTAKAAIGFAAVGQSIARTGSLTADAGTRIIEAGSQIATMFGPKGLVVAALLAFAAQAISSFSQARKESEETAKKFEEDLDRMANAGQAVEMVQALRELERGKPSGTLDTIIDIDDGLIAVRNRISELERSGFVKFNQKNREELERLRDVLKKGEADFKALSDAVRNAPTPTTGGASPFTISAAAPSGGGGRAAATPFASAFGTRAREARERVRAETEAFYQQLGPGQFARIAEAIKANAEKTTKATAESIARFGVDITKIPMPTLPPPPPLTDAQIKELEDAMRLDDIKTTLGQGISDSIGGAFKSGLGAALATGNIKDAFKAMGQAIIQSMANTMVDVAIKAMNFAKLLESIRTFMVANPALAVITAAALLAMAQKAGGKPKSAEMGMTGSPGGLTYSAAGMGGMGATLPTQQIIFGATSATTAAGMQPRQAMNVTIIGPNDPAAQRGLQELMAKANSRGRVG